MALEKYIQDYLLYRKLYLKDKEKSECYDNNGKKDRDLVFNSKYCYNKSESHIKFHKNLDIYLELRGDKIMFQSAVKHLNDKRDKELKDVGELTVVKVKFYCNNKSGHYRDYGAQALVIETSVKECFELLLCPFRGYAEKLDKLYAGIEYIEKLSENKTIEDNNCFGIVCGNVVPGSFFDSYKSKGDDQAIRVNVHKLFLKNKLSDIRQLFEYFHYNV
jgi:hypothetical protein